MKTSSNSQTLLQNLSKKNSDLLKKCTRRKVFAKGEHILLPDNISVFACLIHDGIVRNYYTQSGKDITTMLSFENEICVPYIFNIHFADSPYYLQALTHQTEVPDRVKRV